MRSLVINVGSTSTKVALYTDTEQQAMKTIRHTLDELSAFAVLVDQLDFRKGFILDFLKDNSIKPEELDCIISRGGCPPNAKSGATYINEDLCTELIEHPMDGNPASLGPVIAYSIAKEAGIQSYIYDPISADELNPYAKVFGVKDIYHTSMAHVLNTRATGIAAANDLGLEFNELNLIVVHIGGGNTVALWEKGTLTDTIPTDDGTFSAERCGNIRGLQLLELVEKYGIKTVKTWFGGKGGFVSLLGTNELKEVEKMIEKGDSNALLYTKAMAYQLSKLICSLFPVVHGQVDGIVFTGGGAYWSRLIDEIKYWIKFTNIPTFEYPGENEMKALAEGAYRVWNGKESVNTYTK